MKGPLRSAAIGAMLMLSACAEAKPNDTDAPLVAEREIALPGVAGRIDHLAADPAHHRLFVAEIANGSVDAVDLQTGKNHRITGLAEPQGVAYLPALDQLAVSSGGDGTVEFYYARTLEPVGKLKLGADADNLHMLSQTGQLAVGYGSGAIALIDPEARRIVRSFALPAHPEGFQIDGEKNRAFVNLPNARAVAAIDLVTGTVTTKLRAPHRLTFPMAFDPRAGGLVAIVSRLPAHISWFDPETGTVRRDLPTCGDADDVYRDAKRSLWYVSCGSGKVEVYSETSAGMSSLGAIATGSGARTSIFIPELDRLIVAVPAGWLEQEAHLLVLRPKD